MQVAFVGWVKRAHPSIKVQKFKKRRNEEMMKYVIAGLLTVFSSVNSVVYAGEIEAVLKDSTSSSGFSVKDSAGNSIARFRGDGWVGIGTAIPRARLDVNGQLKYKAYNSTVMMTNTPGYLEYEVNGVGYGVNMWVSSKRFKENITDLEIDSSKIYELNPVSFNYTAERGGEKDFGLIAEDVEKVIPSLVLYNNDGEVFSLKYQLLSVLLLNELKKKKDELDDLKETVTSLKTRIEALEQSR